MSDEHVDATVRFAPNDTLRGVADDDIEDMVSLFNRSVRLHGSKVAVRSNGKALSYSDLAAQSDALGEWMHREVGIGTGDIVALVLQNVPEFVVSAVAIWKVGGVVAPLNPGYKRAELSARLADSAAKLVIAERRGLATLQLALSGIDRNALPILVVSQVATEHAAIELATGSNTVSAFADASVATIPAIRAFGHPHPTDPAVLMYTSGTSGEPKGAILSHRAVTYNSKLSAHDFGMRDHARIFGIAPLFHIMGLVVQMGAAIASAGSLILAYRFEPDVAIATIRQETPTFMIATITAYIALMNNPDASADLFSSFDTLYSGGAPIPPAVLGEFRAKFGRRIATAFGLTETCAPTHITPYERDTPIHAQTGAASIGRLVPGADARIVADDGASVALGEPGELLLRGPMLMDGYWKNPAASAEALADGWLHTGDIVVASPDGWYYLVDRKKDMINASGFKVWPREVENVLYQHESVREAAVIGIPDAYRGESVKAYVTLALNSNVTASQLIDFCREQLASYKTPRTIEVLAEMPKTASGKIMRAALRRAHLTNDSGAQT